MKKKKVDKKLIGAVSVTAILIAILVYIIFFYLVQPKSVEESEGLKFEPSTKKAAELDTTNWQENKKWVSVSGDILNLDESNYRWQCGQDYIEGTCDIYTDWYQARKVFEEHVREYAKDKSKLDPWVGESYSNEAWEKWGTCQGNEEFIFLLKEDIDEAFVRGEEKDPINGLYIGTLSEGQIWLENVYELSGGYGFEPYTEKEIEHNEKTISEATRVEDIGFKYAVPEGYVVTQAQQYWHIMKSEDGGVVDVSTGTYDSVENGRYAAYERYPVRETQGNVTWCRGQCGPAIRYGCIIENPDEEIYIQSNDEKALREFYNSIQF